ncbi:MAG: phage tail tape measure protein, partial [Syntrophales bacterium]|nr:phage tail tape measure protein [Syntrophales bacterium]
MAGELGKVYVVIGADTDEIRKALSDFDKKISGAEKKTKDFGDKLKETGEKMQSVARPMLAFGAAITGGLGLAVRAFGNFDAAMNESLAIMGNVSDSMREQMVNAAEDVARTTTFSAKEAAGAFYYLASAGLDAEQSIAALPGVAAFAQSGMMDLETATEYLMDSQSALGLKVADATQNMENMVRVSDVLVEAANVSNGSIEQFAAALSNSAPMMRQLNMDIEEGVGVLSVYADQGIKGEEAGTRFSIVLRDLQTRAIKNKEAFEKYSVAVFDTNGNMRNMADIISDLEKALAGKTDEQKKAILAEMEFQDRSVSSMLSLVGMSKEIGNYEAKLRAAGGTTKDVAEKQLQTLNNQLKLAKNNVNLAAIQIGSQLAPALVKVSKKIADIAKGFSDWSQKHPALSKALTGLVGIIGGTALAGGTLLFGLGAMAKSVGSLINLFPRLGGPLKGLVGSLGKVGAVGAAAFAGWGIGRLIGSVTGLDKAIEKTADKWIDMLGIVKSTAEEGAGHAEALAKRQEWAALAFEKTGVHASTLRGIIDALLPV